MRKIESLKKQEIIELCKKQSIDTKGKKKKELVELYYEQEIKTIQNAIANGTAYELLNDRILQIVTEYKHKLRTKIDQRKSDMTSDDTSHYLIYKVLGIDYIEGQKIDEYQNTGRFLYKYAGSFLEEVASLCLKFKYPQGSKTTIPNTLSKRPKSFEIDFLQKKDAIEIKWRDATTDGDHITKEHSRIKVIAQAGYVPIRVMFYYPQREQAIKIQSTLQDLYLSKNINGQYYAGEDAWKFIKDYSGFDLLEILKKIAKNS